jgi:hypothetical protein
MSGTDYTTTPNLALYKPISNRAIGTWGDLWNSNADTLDAALGSSANGPFLPLNGGTVSTASSMPSQIILTPTPPGAANAPNGAQLASHLTAQFTGGTIDDPSFFNIHADTTVQGAPVTGIWSLYGAVSYTGTGGNGGLVASAGQGVRKVHNAGGSANNPSLWGALFNYIDQTNTDSAQTNYGSAVEIGMACGGTDSANNRRMLGMYLNKWLSTDAAPVCHMGIQLAANVGSFDLMQQLYGPFNVAAIDLRSATRSSPSAHTLWLSEASASPGDVAWNAAATTRSYHDGGVSAGAGGLHITAPIQIDGEQTIYAPAAPARSIYQSTHTWWVGGWNDNNFYVIDAGGPSIRLTITPAGAIALAATALGFFATTPVAKPTAGGAWAGNTAGKALSTALAALGLITDTSTA